ncbi:maleylpyruvate isomerase family mycothiol-dependent enzyme [Herbidospora mongoliensis]|uniref:maleylpyruvate isomerase family mycothiol-dependent enzyme n=1 Tax=Herbidospora mongoliensis TaxID=688067 RepID=UPI0008298061|nr:maleylpyruvate isomerase family mycothiol-dependent enzyme [Herbidospora mongoliensis]
MTDQATKILRSTYDELAAQVRAFAPEDLVRQSGAADWDVSQVLSHLGSGAEINLLALEGALNGTGAPEGDAIRAIWARWDAMSPVERANAFLDANENHIGRLEGLDPETRETLRIALWFPSEPLDAEAFAGFRLTELALHAWDVQVAFDPGAVLREDAADLLLDRVAGLLAWAGKGDRLGREATLALHVTAPERSFGVAIGEKVEIVDVPAEPDGVLTAPAEWWLRLATGRHAAEYTPPVVELTGSVTLDELRAVFPGF